MKEKKVIVGIATVVAICSAIYAMVSLYKSGLEWFPFMRDTQNGWSLAFTICYFAVAWLIPPFIAAGAVVWLEERLGIRE